MDKRIKVLLVEDSLLVRKILADELNKFPSIEVAGTISKLDKAMEEIIELKPDVLVFNLETTKLDILKFIDKLMQNYPVPVIMLSGQTCGNVQEALSAMELGAVEIMPKQDYLFSVYDLCLELEKKIIDLYNIGPLEKIKAESKPFTGKAEIPEEIIGTKNKMIVIGASTGGTEAIKQVLSKLPPDMPPILIVQHLPKAFTKTFAQRLDELSQLHVKEAEEGEAVKPGMVLIAPGGKHMTVVRSEDKYSIKLTEDAPVHHQRPAVDILFSSVAKCAGKDSIGVILTGIGRDGADGMLELKKNGAYTIAQDEKSCIVYGMPKEAVTLDAVDRIASLEDIPKILASFALE